MNPERFVISDPVWNRIESHLPGKASDCGVTASDNRLFMEALLWRVRTGSPWRDLPSGFGNWNSTFQRFRRWAKSGVFERLFEALSDDPDFEYALIDGTIVTAHQKASGAKGGLKIRLSAGQGPFMTEGPKGIERIKRLPQMPDQKFLHLGAAKNLNERR